MHVCVCAHARAYKYKPLYSQTIWICHDDAWTLLKQSYWKSWVLTYCCYLLLAGACPPCPKSVRVSCYCGRHSPVPRRCGSSSWSCGQRCVRMLECKQHRCSDTCHSGMQTKVVEIVKRMFKLFYFSFILQLCLTWLVDQSGGAEVTWRKLGKFFYSCPSSLGYSYDHHIVHRFIASYVSGMHVLFTSRNGDVVHLPRSCLLLNRQ